MNEASIIDKQALVGYFNVLKSSLYEETERWDILSPFLHDIQSALEKENYPLVLHLIDELEEMMDLEFCK